MQIGNEKPCFYTAFIIYGLQGCMIPYCLHCCVVDFTFDESCVKGLTKQVLSVVIQIEAL